MDIFETIHTLRAIRRFKPDPVPDELIWKVLDAAIHAPSGTNQQPWNFVVIRDPETRKRIGDLYLEVWNSFRSRQQQQPEEDPTTAKIHASADHLAHHLGEAPVHILVTFNHQISSATVAGSSIFPAVQNLMLAARALGLGTVLTTTHKGREAQVKEILGIPEHVETMALIPLGWPRGRFGPTSRRPAEEVTFWDKWGETSKR